MRESGCYKCEDRFLGCHSNCAKYKAYKLAIQKIKDKKQEETKLYANHSKSRESYYKKKGRIGI